MVTVTVDGHETKVPEDSTVLKAAQAVGVKIPTLCYSPHLRPYGGCRVCLVETKSAQGGPARLVPSCACPVEDGQVVDTRSERVVAARKFIIQLLLASTPESPEMQAVAESFGVLQTDDSGLDDIGQYLFQRAPRPEHTKCVKCGLCVRVCSEFVGKSATTFACRGTERRVKTAYDKVAPECIGCGACAYLCPTRAIKIEPAD